MKKKLTLILTVFFVIVFFSCEDDKRSAYTAPVQEVLKPYSEQYPIDIAAIDKYLDEYYIENV